VPAVATPTNLTVKPVISAGMPPPPKTLVTKDLVVGTGTTATKSSTVSVKYVGASFTTGKDFTSSTWTEGKPTTFPLSEVVPGFSQGIVGMKVGGRREIIIPSALGYGTKGQPPTIQPTETLVFVVDLKGVS
jgi:peptidylprolyl isomerase